MPKSKTGPALFELYNKGQGEKSEQERVTSKRSPIAESASAFRSTLANLARTINRDTDSAEVESSPGRAASERVGTGSSVTIDRGCLNVTLTSRMSGIVLALLIVAAIGVFSTGKWVGHNQGIGEGRKQARQSIQGGVEDAIATARKSQPVEGLFAGIGPSPVGTKGETEILTAPGKRASGKRASGKRQSSGSSKAKPRTSGKRTSGNRAGRGSARNANAPVSLIAQPNSKRANSKRPKPRTASRMANPNTAWVKGHTYVVVQSFRSDAREDARKAQAYLADQGIDAEIVTKSGQPIRLIATQGFNHKNKTQRDLAGRFLKRIRTIGKSYSKAGGRYKLEGYLATLTKNAW